MVTGSGVGAPAGRAVTIGVALAVPEPWATRLRDVRRLVGDPDADRMPTHLTLIPPNTVALDVLVDIHAGLRTAAREVTPFEIALAGSGTFRPVSAVSYAHVVEGAEGCAAVEEAVRRHAPVRPRRHPYHPHVTVAMDVPDAALDRAEELIADLSARWRVDELSVYVRDRAGMWHPDRDVPLG